MNTILKAKYDKQRYKQIPEYYAKKNAKYWQEHKESRQAYMVEYRKTYKARKAELEKKYYENMCIKFNRSVFQVKMALKAWSARVRELDNEMCKNCSSTEELNAHHIEPTSLCPEKALDINNGVTLCRPCHKDAHGGSFK